MFGGGLPVISTNRKSDRKMSGRPFIQRTDRCHYTKINHECADNVVYAAEEECIHDSIEIYRSLIFCTLKTEYESFFF